MNKIMRISLPFMNIKKIKNNKINYKREKPIKAEKKIFISAFDFKPDTFEC